VTPNQCHTGGHVDILNGLKEVYEQAKLKHPERWSKSTRDWSSHQSVALNPVSDHVEEKTKNNS